MPIQTQNVLSDSGLHLQHRNSITSIDKTAHLKHIYTLLQVAYVSL